MERRKGYVLVYSVIAMMLSCALVLSTVTIVFYYGNNIKRTVGENGARMLQIPVWKHLRIISMHTTLTKEILKP